MEKIKNKIVFITGASSGIGRSCAKIFAKKGANLILAARRIDRLKSLEADLTSRYNIQIKCIKLDVRRSKEVYNTVDALKGKWKNIDILINNAGLSRGLVKIHEGLLTDWNEMIDTNVKGLLYVSRAVIPLMVKRNKGHIINIGSIAGREVYPNGNVYCASKYAVDAITKGMRIDLNGTDIRVTTIDPGLVETEFSLVRFHGDKNKAKSVYKGIEPLTPDDVADAVYFAATRRKNVVVADMLLFPLCQASSMVVNRKT
jgi:serine 3-dehydrogenase